MNQRIQDLMKQSMVEYQFDLRFSPEKFAELIVRECFEAAMIESKGHMNPIDLIKRMKEQVGVEK